MKLIHTADNHANRDRADVVIAALDEIGRTAEAEQVDAIVDAGDIWDHATMNVEGSRFADILQAFKRLADKSPVFLVYGTPTHDAHGSLEVFETIEAKHPIRILRPGQPVIHAGTIFFGVPEPSPRWLVPEADTMQAAQAALRTALSSHMIAIGAQRRAHAGPAVLVYHGQVSGSRLSNGTVLEGGTGIMASVDDLKATGCDYIAMGDIHDPQAVGAGVGIVAHYPGSLPPQSFGEEHSAGFNVVEIYSDVMSFGVDVRRVELPQFPARRTIRVNWVDGRPDVTVTPEIINGFMVKMEISCDKADVPMIDETEMTRRLRAAGAAEGSLIAIKARPTETIRFAEIAEKDTPEEKLALWFEQSGSPISDELRIKHRQIAAEVSGEGSGPRPGHIELTRLVLRGATGLKDVSGHDEIDLDLDALPDGLVALIGSNGSGKTTIVENFHPWGQLLTRGGTLKSHFFLKDSMRDLYWTDHRDGAKYRSKILINGAAETVDPKYFLFKLNGTEWESIGDTGGTLKPYEAEVERLFGSLDLFLKSAFVTQAPPRGISDIATATQSERKVIFSALCGLEFWEMYKEKAEIHRKDADRRAELLEAELRVMEGNLADPETLAANRTAAEAEVTTLDTELKELAETGKVKADESARLKSMAAAQIVVRDQLKASENRATELRMRESTAKNLLAGDDAALAFAPAAEATLRDLDGWEAAKREQDAAWETWRASYDAETATIAEERRQFDADQKAKSDAFKPVMDMWDAKRRDIEGQLATRRQSLTMASNRASTESATLTQLIQRAAVPDNTTCSHCGQDLHGQALQTVKDAREKLEARIALCSQESEMADKELNAAQLALDEAIRALAGHDATKPVAPAFVSFTEPPRTVPAWNDTTRADLARKIQSVNVADLRAKVQAAAVARDQKATHEKALADVQSDLAVELKRAEELRGGLDTDVLAKSDAAEAEVTRYRNLWSEANGRRGAAMERVAAAGRAIEERDQKATALDGRKADLARLHAESAAWESLRYAYSNKGVQALELDALAPSVAAATNAGLETFGSDFRIEFKTTDISGSGKDAKQIEVFQILVMNQKTGVSREISLLSGGERVWVLRALYDAFGLIRAKNSDVRFLTGVQDEADGALDVNARVSYLRMIEDAHRRSGRRKTVIVTHSEALQAMIQTKVFVSDLGPRKEGAA